MHRHELVNGWRQAGINEGDTVLLHSSLKLTFKSFLRKGIKLSANTILDSFLEAVGSTGTLILPLFNFDFSKGISFDIRTSPSQMGMLTEIGRQHPKAIRTGHPIYSFSVIGHNSDKFADIDNYSGYGKDSPFNMLKQLNGKIAVLGLTDQHSMTFYHYIEEMNQVSYRYMKEFSGQYTNYKGQCRIKAYGLFVRNLEKGICTHVNPMGELLWENGIYTGYRPNSEIGLRVASASDIYGFVSKIIKSGGAEGLLYKSQQTA
jgi:aminoglycoside 3-N-acetyltransferase